MSESTVVSYAVLCGTGIYCMYRHTNVVTFPNTVYFVVIVHSAFGIYGGLAGSRNQTLMDIYNTTGFVQDVIAVSLIATDMWFRYNQPYLAYFHLIASLAPAALQLLKLDQMKESYLRGITAVNCLSLGVACILYENYYGVAAAVTYIFSYFYFKSGEFTIGRLPALDIYNYGMCAYCYFVLIGVAGEYGKLL